MNDIRILITKKLFLCISSKNFHIKKIKCFDYDYFKMALTDVVKPIIKKFEEAPFSLTLLPILGDRNVREFFTEISKKKTVTLEFFFLAVYIAIKNTAKEGNCCKTMVTFSSLKEAIEEIFICEDIELLLAKYLNQKIESTIPIEKLETPLSNREIVFICTKALSKHKKGCCIPVDSYTSSVLFEILKDHYNYKNKIKNGIKNFVTVSHPDGVSTFALINLEGTAETFSYEKCLSGFGSTVHIQKVLRLVVLKDTLKHKEQYIKKNSEDGFCVCEFTHKKIPMEQISVDHVIPFSVLLENWMKEEDFSAENIKMNKKNPVEEWNLPCPFDEFKKKWKEYHREHAILQCIHEDINFELKNEGRNSRLCKNLFNKYTKLFEKYQK